MLIASDRFNNLILAAEATASDSYTCPSCLEKVILKKGKLKVAHFAHQRDSNCISYGEGETIEHLQGKMDLYEWIRKADIPVRLEVFLPKINQRADILYTDNGVNVAIEYQCSPISIEDVCHRTKGYESQDVKVIWITGSKLAIKSKLTALQRSFIGEEGNTNYYFFNYNSYDKHFVYYSVGHTLKYRALKSPEKMIEIFRKTIDNAIDTKIRYRFAAPKDIKKNLSKLQLMSYYKNYYYVNFFQLLYEHGMNLDNLPEEVHHSLESEWMIRTVSFEWKLRVMLWLNNLPENQVITKRLLMSQIQKYKSERQIIMYACPNISHTSYEKPFDEFIDLLAQCSYLKVIKEGMWRVNNEQPLLNKKVTVLK